MDGTTQEALIAASEKSSFATSSELTGAILTIPRGGKSTFPHLAPLGSPRSRSLSTSCQAEPVGRRAGCGRDCNDESAEINPEAPEICNGEDENCDDVADDGLPRNDYCRDADDDGYGDMTDCLEDCAAPTGYVDNDNDCADDNAEINPEQTGFFSESFTNAFGVESFDYNCDGVESPDIEVDDVDTVPCPGGDICEYDAHWLDTIPGCGEIGEVYFCRTGGMFGCDSTDESGGWLVECH